MDIEAKTAEISEAKIRRYLLNPEHPSGKVKARFFERMGYTLRNWSQLAEDLRIQHLSQPVFRYRPSPFGRKYRITAPLTGPKGVTCIVTSVWLIPKGGRRARLITVEPASPKGDTGLYLTPYQEIYYSQLAGLIADHWRRVLPPTAPLSSSESFLISFPSDQRIYLALDQDHLQGAMALRRASGWEEIAWLLFQPNRPLAGQWLLDYVLQSEDIGREVTSLDPKSVQKEKPLLLGFFQTGLPGLPLGCYLSSRWKHLRRLLERYPWRPTEEKLLYYGPLHPVDLPPSEKPLSREGFSVDPLKGIWEGWVLLSEFPPRPGGRLSLSEEVAWWTVLFFTITNELAKEGFQHLLLWLPPEEEYREFRRNIEKEGYLLIDRQWKGVLEIGGDERRDPLD